MRDWRNEPYVGVGIELKPIPGRGCYQEFLHGEPLLVGSASFPVGYGAFDLVDPRLRPGPYSAPAPGRSGYLVHLLTEHDPLPGGLFPWIKAVHAQVQHVNHSTMWRRPPIRVLNEDQMAPLVRHGFDRWYLIIAREAVMGQIRKSQQPLSRAHTSATAMADCAELPADHRHRYRTLAALFDAMRAKTDTLLDAAQTLAPHGVEQRVDDLALSDLVTGGERWAGRVKSGINAAECWHDELGHEILSIAAGFGMPAGRLRLNHAMCEFAAELETTPSHREASKETQYRGPLCFDMPSSGRAYPTFPKKPPDMARWDEVTARVSHFARDGRVDGAALTARISERGGLPPAFFSAVEDGGPQADFGTPNLGVAAAIGA
ncbi:MAG: hypothetical protein ABI212_14595 [Burkholderiaceae bacterium]